MGKTFEQLKASIGDWLQVNTNRVADTVRGDLINMAQREIMRNHTLWFGETSDTFPTVAGTNGYDFPTGFVRFQTHGDANGSPIWYLDDDNAVVWVKYLPKDEFDATYGGETSADYSEPINYTLWGGQVILGPTPDDVYTMHRDYYKVLADLADSSPNNENVFTDNAWEVLLWRVLLFATVYVIEDSRAQIWKTKSDVAEADLVREHAYIRASARRIQSEEPG